MTGVTFPRRWVVVAGRGWVARPKPPHKAVAQALAWEERGETVTVITGRHAGLTPQEAARALGEGAP